MSKVKVIHTAKELHQFRQKLNENSQTLGFVPTMGALHDGHVSLIKKSADENDYTLISIFVNPKQFNNSEDLKQYPRTLDADLTLLEGLINCVVFAPDEEELYPKNDGFIPMELGSIGRVLEGAFRPGHFEGVVHVVHNLFRLAEANQAYFGQKDFQQLATQAGLVGLHWRVLRPVGQHIHLFAVEHPGHRGVVVNFVFVDRTKTKHTTGF